MFRIPVLEWSSEDVKAWLKHQNIEERENNMDKISGEQLLNISKVSIWIIIDLGKYLLKRNLSQFFNLYFKYQVITSKGVSHFKEPGYFVRVVMMI